MLLCVAILASIGLVLSIEKLQRCRIAKGKKILISCLPPEALAKVGLLFSVFTLILFEDLNFPPFHVTDVSLRPPVYQWLTSRPRDSKIIEYPVDTSGNDFGGGCPEWLDPETRREYPGYYSALFQRIHRKEILDYGKLPNEEKSALIDLSKSDAYEVLSLHGVDYIIIHAKDYFPQGNPFDECQERRIMERPEEVYEGFELIEEFEDAVVYRLMNDKF